jgi:hypothetical protein
MWILQSYYNCQFIICTEPSCYVSDFLFVIALYVSLSHFAKVLPFLRYWLHRLGLFPLSHIPFPSDPP